MKRHIPGLLQSRSEPEEQPEGLFLVQVDQARFRYHPLKPFYTLHLRILDPVTYSGHTLTGRLYCSSRALWKLHWFLRDFGYDADLLAQEQVDEKALVGLRGVVRVSYTRLNGHAYRNLEAFAPAAEWDEMSGQMVEASDDL
jgi:hypothetical protein